MKLVRIVIRFKNNLDFLILFKENLLFEFVKINKAKPSSYNSSNNFGDKLAIIQYTRIRDEMNVEDESLESRKKLLKFNNEVIKQSLLNDDLNSGDEKMKNLFSEIALKINFKLFRIFEEEFNEQNPTSVKNSTRDFLIYYLKLKEENKENVILLDNINQEIILQIYRHLNRNEFTENSVKINTIFGFFYVLSYYLEMSPAISNAFKKWINFLIQSK